MKLNKIMAFFYMGLPICIILRMIQIGFTIDFESGFYKEGYTNYGIAILLVIMLFCAAVILFASKAFESPERPPRMNFALTLVSAFAACVLLYEVGCEVLPLVMLPWQIVIVKVAGLITAGYFAVFAVRFKIDIKLPSIVHIVPVVYLIIRTIFTFINISSLAIISDNILIMTSYCFAMLFFINYAKLYNKIDTERNFRKILATGLCSSVAALTQSISYFVINFVSETQYTHTDSVTNLTLLGIGLFVLGFVISHFSIDRHYIRRYK